MMRKGLRFLFLLVVALAFVPGNAYAWDFLPDGQMWAGDVGSNHCATVHAGQIYDAATYAVGSDPNKISASVRVKLSDPNYGGRFYEYAQTFHKMESWDDYPEWLPAYVGLAQLIGNGLAGDFNIYNSEASISLYEGAMIDFRRVLAGEDLSGGGGGSGGNVNVSQCYELVCANLYNRNGPNNYLYARAATIDSDGNVVLGSGQISYSCYTNNSYYVDSVRVYVPASMYDFLVRDWSGNNCCFQVGFPSNKAYTANVGFNVSDSPITVSRDFLWGDTYADVLHFSGNSYSYIQSGVNAYYDSEGVFFVLSDANVSLSPLSGIRSPGFYSQPFVIPSYVAPPDGDWPEPEAPTTPDPPEVPTPTAPTVTPDPTPTDPTVIWPTAPIVVNPPEVTVEVTPTGLDYTELLTRINDNLNSIDSYAQAINSGLNSLRPDIIGGFDDVVSAIRNIYTYLQHLDSILERHCKHLRDALDDGIYNLELYIKSLFQWLPNQLNYDAEFTYDDSAVTTLLRRILNKIPGGSTDIPVSYEPNPQADEPGFFDWLLDLWHRFLIDLVSVLPDELGALVDAFSQLTHYFPFSIPWDLFALLSLFEHEPVTPVFDVPWGFGGDEGEIQMVRVDLSAWDGVMEMVRPVFLVGFCWQLAMITKDLLANFDINKGGV